MSNLLTNPIRVLLVDDEPAILRSLGRVLTEHGLSIETSICAAEADAILNHYEFDVVVCDHNMPGRTGLEFLAETKEKRPELVTMMLSGQISGISVAEDWASEIGVHTVFAKPFDATAIAEKVKSAVREKRLEAKTEPLFLVDEAEAEVT
jgi:DNA-binding NtrC family response regulator